MTISFSEWKKVTAESKRAEYAKWCTASREGLGIVYSIAGEFVSSAQFPIIDMRVGVGSVPEWIIHAWVEKETLTDISAQFKENDRVDGFKIIFRESNLRTDYVRSINFNDWLKLSDEKRQDWLMKWDADKREGLDIALGVAGLLIERSEMPIIDVACVPYQGVWHIHAMLKDVECQIDLAKSEFLGIQILWTVFNYSWVD